MTNLNNLSNNRLQYKSLWLNVLDKFLHSQGAFPVIKLHGFLTAVNSSPNMILPSQWLRLSKIQEINFESTEQATEIMNNIMLLYNNINISLREKTYKPILYIPPETQQNNVSYKEIWKEIKHNIHLWGAGYWMGVNETWPSFKEHLEYDEEIHSLFGIMYCLTLSEEGFKEKAKEFNMTVEEYYKVMIDCLPNAAIEIYDFWLDKPGDPSITLASKLTNEAKIGRNEDCHCGSGKKFKKCCLH